MESSNPVQGAAAGAIGGLLGSAAMVLFNHVLAATGFGAPPAEREKDAARSVFRYGFGTAAGAVYGALAATEPKVTRGGGVPFGAAVFLTAGELGIPLARLSRKPTDYPPARDLAGLVTHLVYGLTLETVRRLIMRRRARPAYDLSSLGV